MIKESVKSYTWKLPSTWEPGTEGSGQPGFRRETWERGLLANLKGRSPGRKHLSHMPRSMPPSMCAHRAVPQERLRGHARGSQEKGSAEVEVTGESLITLIIEAVTQALKSAR